MDELPCHHSWSLSAGICWILSGEPAALPALIVPGINSWRCMRLEVKLASGLLATRGSPYYWEREDEVIGGQIVSSDQPAFGFIQPKLSCILMAHGIFTRLVKSELLASVNVEKNIRLPICISLWSQCFPGKSKVKYIFLLSVCRSVSLYAGNKPPKACCYTIDISS